MKLDRHTMEAILNDTINNESVTEQVLAKIDDVTSRRARLAEALEAQESMKQDLNKQEEEIWAIQEDCPHWAVSDQGICTLCGRQV